MVVWGAESLIWIAIIEVIVLTAVVFFGRLIEGLAAGHGGGTSRHSAKIGGYNETVEGKNGFQLYGRQATPAIKPDLV